MAIWDHIGRVNFSNSLLEIPLNRPQMEHPLCRTGPVDLSCSQLLYHVCSLNSAQGLANFFSQGPDIKYSRLCGLKGETWVLYTHFKYKNHSQHVSHKKTGQDLVYNFPIPVLAAKWGAAKLLVQLKPGSWLKLGLYNGWQDSHGPYLCRL